MYLYLFTLQLNYISVSVMSRDNFLWLHCIFALVYFIVTLLCMAHHSIRLEYREDEKVCHHRIILNMQAMPFHFTKKKQFTTLVSLYLKPKD